MVEYPEEYRSPHYDGVLEKIEMYLEAAKKNFGPELEDARNLYNGLFGKIEENLPNGWEKVVMYVRYTGKYEIKFFVLQSRHWKDCYSIPGVNKSALVKLFDKYSKKRASIKEVFGEKKPNSIMTFAVNRNGSWKNYQDFKEDFVMHPDWELIWKKKYLR